MNSRRGFGRGSAVLITVILVVLLQSVGCADPQPAPPSAATAAPSKPTLVPAKAGDTSIRPADGMTLVYVAAGTLQMGSSPEQIAQALTLCKLYPDAYGKCRVADFEEEAPQHSVAVAGFWIDRTEVSSGQYELCVAAGSCNASRLADDPTYNGKDHPVAGIPRQDAADYCRWAGGRLPSEPEWEYAARGPEGNVYPWGDEFICKRGNFGNGCSRCDDGYSGSSPVGSFPAGASWCGALDMAGNMWEWVAGEFAQYPIPSESLPGDKPPSDEGVLRGGSWAYCPAFLRSAYRYPVLPSANYLAVGFRCAVPAAE